MIGSISTERVFSLSCFEGLRLLRKHEARQPNLLLPELISLVERVEADGLSLDLEASVHLSKLVEYDATMDGAAFYQACIRAVLRQRQPAWTKFMKSGRRRFARELSLDERSVFHAAGLMSDPPAREVVFWWDDISGYARLTGNLESMEQARAAELLTLEGERKRLREEGICKEPKWPGLDDNYAGYDILTYEAEDAGLTNRMIEVKSTIASPPRFVVSREEWKTAERAREAYSFHVWDMQKKPPQLYVKSVEEVAPHIPQDKGGGQWRNVEVRVSKDSGRG